VIGRPERGVCAVIGWPAAAQESQIDPFRSDVKRRGLRLLGKSER